MTNEPHDLLETRRQALNQELSTLKEAIVDINLSPPETPSRQEHLKNLLEVQATRSKELKQVEDQLARKS